jgi:biotin operon repressor
VEFNKGDCRWFVMGQASEVRRTDERSVILNTLLEADEPMSPQELSIATGASRNNVDQLLYKMAKAGEVIKAKRGRYVHPTRLDLIVEHASPPIRSIRR